MDAPYKERTFLRHALYRESHALLEKLLLTLKLEVPVINWAAGTVSDTVSGLDE